MTWDTRCHLDSSLSTRSLACGVSKNFAKLRFAIIQTEPTCILRRPLQLAFEYVNYSRVWIVGNSYLGITSGLPVIQA